MPMPSLPTSINAAKWKSAAKDADKNVLAALEKVSKAHDAIVAGKLLGVGKPASLDEATKVQGQLDGHAKTVQAAVDAAAALVKAGNAIAGDLKKDKAKAELAKLLAGILTDAGNYAKSVETAYDQAQALVSDAAEKFEAEKKKAEAAAAKAAEKDGEDDGESDAMANEKDDKKFFEGLKAKYKGFFGNLRNLGAKLTPEQAAATKTAQVKFRMVSQGKVFGVGISKNSFGEGELKIARRMAGLTSGGKDSKGIIYWNSEDKVFVFEGGNVPTGAANATALKIALKQRIGYAPKIRIQKPGEKGEDSEGPAEEDPEAGVGATPEQGAGGGRTAAETAAESGGASPEAAAQAQALIARLDPLKAKLEQRIEAGGPDAERLRTLERAVREGAARNPDGAKKAYEALVQLLGAAPAAGTGAPLPALERATKDWITLRKRYASEVKALANSLDTLYREELATNDAAVRKAIAEAKAKLTRTADLIGPELETALAKVLRSAQREAQRAEAAKAKATLEALLKRLMGDPVFMSLDGKNNELKPDMTVVKDVQTTLTSVSAALKI